MERQNLTSEEAKNAMKIALQDKDGYYYLSFISAMVTKGETAEELFGFYQAVNENAIKIRTELNSKNLIDLSGTGGAKLKTINVSTAASFIVAGADVKVAENFDINKKDFLFKFAMFLSIAIGQGQNYHHGLFGPLPIPEGKETEGKDKLAILYSFSVKDEKMIDPRASKRNFIMIAFVLGTQVSNFFDNRTIIRKIYEDQMKKITELKQINTEFLAELRQNLLSRCVPDWSSA